MKKQIYIKPYIEILELSDTVSIMAGTTEQDDWADGGTGRFDTGEFETDDYETVKANLWE